MLTIHKYPFIVDLTEPIEMELPSNYKILKVERQHDQPYGTASLWALVNPKAPTAPVLFRVFGTGHDIDTRAIYRHVGTWQDEDKVWHMFSLLTMKPTV